MMIRYIILIIMGVSLFGCEKRDVLAEQGEKTGNDYPYMTLSSIPNSRPTDTINVATRFWAIFDDIDRLNVYQDGYKVRDLAIDWQFQYTVDTVSVDKSISYTLQNDSIKYPETSLFEVVNDGIGLDTFYRTSDNAYVFIKPWMVPADYAIAEWEGADVLDSLGAEDFGKVVDFLIDKVDRWDVLQIVPEADSAFFAVDDMGAFTGALTAAGKTQLKTVLSRDLLKTNLTAASFEESSEIKLRAEVKNKSGIVVEDESTFDILN